MVLNFSWICQNFTNTLPFRTRFEFLFVTPLVSCKKPDSKVVAKILDAPATDSKYNTAFTETPKQNSISEFIVKRTSLKDRGIAVFF
jgi:hypothetical protein